jgi:hypothetical protein
MPFPSILANTLSPKVTLPLSVFVIVRNLSLSPVTCFEHPLSIYHFHFLFFAYRDILHSDTFSSICFSLHIFLSCLLVFNIFKECIGNLHSLVLWP